MNWSFFTGERPGSDSLLLADFAHAASGSLGADLGCGSGVLTVLLLLYGENFHITGVDIRESAVASCRENLRRYALSDRGDAVVCDLRSAPFENKSLDFIVSNPPYFPAGCGGASPDAERRAQRTESATIFELCSAVSRFLKDGGQFFLVHRRDRERDIRKALSLSSLTVVRQRDMFSFPEKPAPIFLLEAVKGAPQGEIVKESILLRNADGQETEEYRKICHWEA